MTASNFNALLTCKQVENQAEWKRRQHLVAKLRNKLARIIDVKATPDHLQRLIIPMVSPPGLDRHFFVACFDFSVHDPAFLLTSLFLRLSRTRAEAHQASKYLCVDGEEGKFVFQQIHSARKEVPLYTTVRC
jgi:hypothetical protein